MNKDLKIKEASFFPNPNPIFKVNKNFENGYWRAWNFDGLSVIASVALYDDVEWLHVSFARERRLPSYKDLQLVKREFFGDDKKAIMVFSDKENYVNIHPNCLHLWYTKEKVLPEFSLGLGTL